jgi:hypothetical protein
VPEGTAADGANPSRGITERIQNGIDAACSGLNEGIRIQNGGARRFRYERI